MSALGKRVFGTLDWAQIPMPAISVEGGLNRSDESVPKGVSDEVPKAANNRSAIRPTYKRRRDVRFAIERKARADSDERDVQVLGEGRAGRLVLIHEQRVYTSGVQHFRAVVEKETRHPAGASDREP